MHRMLSAATKQAVNQLLPDASYTGWHEDFGTECKGMLNGSRVASYGIASNRENLNEPPPLYMCGTPGIYVLQDMVDACCLWMEV